VLFLVAFGALFVGGAVILLLARYAPHPNAHLNLVARATPGGRAMGAEEFRALVIDILDALELEIVMEHADGDGLDVVARSNDPLTGGRFLVRGIWQVPGDVVDQPHVVRLAEHVRADGRAQKGILMTPWPILTDGLGNLEAPLELIDGRKLRELVEQHLDAKRLDQLAQYRGFGL
jgi:hypothetical protein